jgi:hypothetical protein
MMENINKVINRKYKLLFCLLMMGHFCACEKFVEIPESKNQIESKAVYADSAATTSALLGIYFTMGAAANSAFSSLKYLNLYTDDFNYTATIPIAQEFAQSSISSNNSYNSSFWTALYSVIYQSNLMCYGVDSSPLSVKAKDLFKGEALFLRSLAYYYLALCYGDVPLILNGDVNQNKLAGQKTATIVLEQVIADLLLAKELLPDDYQGLGKGRANKYAVLSLLARISLHQQNWQKAFEYANQVIAGNYGLGTLNTTFTANAKETIFEFWNPNGFLPDASAYIPPSSTALPPYTLSVQLLDSYPTNDRRKSEWVAFNTVTTSGLVVIYPYMAKYKNRVAGSRTEYLVCLRLAEQYLIRAEAQANLEQTDGAIADLNKIRERAGLTALYDLDEVNCLIEIAAERRREFFGEGAIRFADLKRRGELNAVMSVHRSSWRIGVSQVLPIPANEIIYNTNLIQNEGY